MKAREEIDNQDVLVTDLKQVQEELNDDSKFLKDQLKECKANNTKLKIGLSKSHNKYENLLNEAKNQNKTLQIEIVEKDQINIGISCKIFINLSFNF